MASVSSGVRPPEAGRWPPAEVGLGPVPLASAFSSDFDSKNEIFKEKNTNFHRFKISIAFIPPLAATPLEARKIYSFQSMLRSAVTNKKM